MLRFWIVSAALVLFASWNAQLWLWFGTDGVNALLLLVSAVSALALVSLWALAGGRGQAGAPGDRAGRPALALWIFAALVAATVGVALDKGFADDTPPYDEPVLAQIGVVVFFLGTLSSLALAALAVVRAALRPRSGAAG